MEKYADMDRKQKQLMLLEYKYKSDRQLFDSTMGQSDFDSKKFFNSVEDIQAFKEEAAKDDISLTKRRDFVTGERRTTNTPTISMLDEMMAPFGEEAYRNALELSEAELDPIQGIKELYIIQSKRLAIGLQYELEVGLGNNPETEACRAGLESILRTANEMINGKKYNLEANHYHSLVDEISRIELKDDYIDVQGGDISDYDDYS